MPQRSDDPAAPAPFTGGGRRPYERPQVTFREHIEVITALCDPSPFGKGDPAACPSAAPPQS